MCVNAEKLLTKEQSFVQCVSELMSTKYLQNPSSCKANYCVIKFKMRLLTPDDKKLQINSSVCVLQRPGAETLLTNE